MSKAVKLHSKAVAPVPTLAHARVTSVVVRIEHVTRDVTSLDVINASVYVNS